VGQAAIVRKRFDDGIEVIVVLGKDANRTIASIADCELRGEGGFLRQTTQVHHFLRLQAKYDSEPLERNVALSSERKIGNHPCVETLQSFLKLASTEVSIVTSDNFEFPKDAKLVGGPAINLASMTVG
jgi:hypothetical protein